MVYRNVQVILKFVWALATEEDYWTKSLQACFYHPQQNIRL